MSTNILACISSHGFGHLGMTSPLLNALVEQMDVSLIVRCTLPENIIRKRIHVPFELIPEKSDFGMVMTSAIDIDYSASFKSYVNFHDNWEENLDKEKESLRRISPDLIISNIPYITIVAAKELGIPCVAYCSLNWASIFEYCFKDRKEAIPILKQIRAAYSDANSFICPAPSMDMPFLKNIHRIGPIAEIGESKKSQILNGFFDSNYEKLVMISPGGIDTEINLNEWPKLPGIAWLVSWDDKLDRDDMLSTNQLNDSFTDVLTSCDAIISKPGYGIVSESVCNAVPALFVKRGDWAEEPFLVNWWLKNGNALEVSREDFFQGNVADHLQKLWKREKQTKQVSCETDAVNKIAAMCNSSRN